jgi:hypothetical protein
MPSRVALSGQSHSVVRFRFHSRFHFVAVLFFAAAALVSASPAFAQSLSAPTVHDTQLWTQVVATVKLSQKWLTHLEAQSRWSEDLQGHDQLIIRNAIGRRLSPRVTVWGGHAWTPRTLEEGWAHEQRIWEQLSATFPAVGAWTPSMRIRQEQRFLDSWGDVSHRLRMMGRAVRPVDAEKLWSIVAWNEVLITLDETENGPAQGVDQNRLFAGVLRKLSNHAGLESGYLWRTSDPAGPVARRHDHVLFAWLNLTF